MAMSSWLWRSKEPWQVVGIAQKELSASPEVPEVLQRWEVLNEEVRHLANKRAERTHGDEEVLRHSWVAGPCILPAYGIVALTICAPVIMFMLGLHTAHATGTHETMQYSSWVWIPFLALLLVHLRLEYRILTYLLLPTLQVIGNYKVFGFNLGFSCWFFYTFAQSAVNFLGLATVSLFMAVRAVQQEKFWTLWCPWWVAWVLNLTPALLVLLITLPKWSEWQAQRGRGKERAIEWTVSADGRYHYSTWFGKTMFTGELIDTLMEGAGSASLTDSGISYQLVSARNLLLDIEDRQLCCVRGKLRTQNKAVDDEALTCKRILQHLCSIGPRVVFRIIAVGLLRTSLQADIQISFLRFQVCSRQGQAITGQKLFSIIVSLLGIIPLLTTIITNEYSVVPMAKRLSEVICDVPAKAGDLAELEILFRRFKTFKWLTRAAGMLVILMLVHAFAQLIALHHESLR